MNRKFVIIIILILSVVSVSAVNMTERTSNCVSILNYEGITTLVGSLMLLIFGIMIVVNALKEEDPNMIVFGIVTVIIGFGGLLFGNYIFSIIHSVLC